MFRALRAGTFGPGARSDLLRPRRLLSQTQLEHAAFRNRFEGIQGAIEKPLLIGAPVQNPEARRTDAGTTLSPSRRKNTSGACAKAIGSRRR